MNKGGRVTGRSQHRRQSGEVSRFVERLALDLVEAGMPRMASRVFVALFATDSGRLTASELAEVLQVSPAAVSGAVRYLSQVNLVMRERDPEVRRDFYLVRDNALYESLASRDQFLSRVQDSLTVGVQALGADTTAGMRAAEMLSFIEYLDEELPALLARWRAQRAEK